MDGESDLSAVVSRLTSIEAKMELLLHQNHHLLHMVQKLDMPVDLLDAEQAAQRSGLTKSMLRRLTDMLIFTDGRPPGKRFTKARRRYYADECMAYRTEGERGVRRLREELGRM